jgi:hypothetical protein
VGTSKKSDYELKTLAFSFQKRKSKNPLEQNTNKQ